MKIKSILISAAVMTTVAVPSMAANLLIDLNADGFTDGAKVTTWQNNGSLGGSFNLVRPLPGDYGDTAAVAGTVLGKKSAKFLQSSYTLQDSAGNNIAITSGLLGKAQYTMSAWIRNAAPRYQEYYFSWGAAGDPDPGNGVSFSDGKGNHPATPPYTWSDGKGPVEHANGINMKWDNVKNENFTPSMSGWRLVTVTNDGTTEKAYIDNGAGGFTLVNSLTLPTAFNVKINTYTKADATTVTPNFFSLGNAMQNTHNAGFDNPGFWGGTWFEGSMASLKLYDGAISDSELSALYTVPEPGSMLALFSGLVGLAGFATRRKRA